MERKELCRRALAFQPCLPLVPYSRCVRGTLGRSHSHSKPRTIALPREGCLCAFALLSSQVFPFAPEAEQQKE